MVAGAARSGTTWLADLIASQMPSRIMFEPFHPELVADFARFNYFQYMRPDQQDAALREFTARVLSGRIRHPWIDRQVETLFPQWRIIKDVRTCLFLRWIHEQFPKVPKVFIIRHPCAVLASVTRLHWRPDRDLERMLVQKPLIDDFLGEKLAVIRRAGSAAEKHAIVWCISNLVPLIQFRDAPLHVVFYENLCRSPEAEIPKLFQAIGRPFDASVYRYARRPSTTTRQQSAVVRGRDPVTDWRQELPGDTIDKVLGIVEEFGLGQLYGSADIPMHQTSNPGDIINGY